MSETVRGRVVRPNIECTNGMIHLVDTVMIDDAPPYQVIASGGEESPKLKLTLFTIIQMALITLIHFQK